jgi:23S rRNA (guanosine2251-2'-O)-methyltransferase
MVYGLHAVGAAIKRNAEGVAEVFVDAGRQDPRIRKLLDAAQSAGVRIQSADARRLDGLAPGSRHQGVVAFVQSQVPASSLEEVLDDVSGPPLLLVLDGVQDPHNLGACLRVADGMGVHAVVAPKDRAVGLSPTVHKVASGAAESVPFVMVTNLARTLRGLKDQGIWVVGTAEAGPTSLFDARLEGPLALVLGAEGEGLRRLTQETCDELISIPMLGTVESLNVSVAAGICLYEARRQRRAAS